MADTRSYRAFGKVQRVMFRQTLIRAMMKRNLIGGASNMQDRVSVEFTVSGDADRMDELVERLQTGEPINDWGARVDYLERIDTIDFRKHQVRTDNVDAFKWKSNVTFYI